jgi:predicted metalloprotease with PDZ domain
MRKWIAAGSALMIMAVVVGASYAQEATPDATATAEAAAPLAPLAPARPWLGITLAETANGVTVQGVAAGSPAETAKLQTGDLIVSANGTPVAGVSDLQNVLASAKAGDGISLSVKRGNDTITVQVTLANRPVPAGRPQPPLPTDPLQAAQRILHVNLQAANNGYQVTAVDPRNPFQLAVGDVITAVNGSAITSADWATLLAPTNGSTTVTLTVTRNGQETTLQAQMLRFGGRGVRRGGFDGQQPGDQPGERHGQGMPHGDGDDDHFDGLPNDGQPPNNLPGNGALPEIKPATGNNSGGSI